MNGDHEAYNNVFSRQWSSSSKPVVLIVEDHDDTREVLRILLAMAGCHVIEAEDGQHAMRLAEMMRPNLILLDMKIPLLDGLSVTRMIRSHPTLNSVPIVAITGIATPQFQADAFQAGCNYCFVKPIDFNRLEELIKVLVRSPRQPSPLDSHYSLALRSKGVLCSYQFH